MNGVEIAKAALMEAGRPDIAASVLPNRAGVPGAYWLEDHPEDEDVIVRAFLMGHLAMRHVAHRRIGVCCHTCWDHMVVRHSPAGCEVGVYPCNDEEDP